MGIIEKNYPHTKKNPFKTSTVTTCTHLLHRCLQIDV